MITLKDVAEKAKVSVSTVSYVLNNKKIVRPETFKRINDAIQELGYVPNLVARGLKTKRTLTLGIILPDIANMFFAEIIRGIEDTVNEFGYSIILCNTDNDDKREVKYLSTLLSKDIDGMIFIGTGKVHQISRKATKVPIVVVDRKVGRDFCSVYTDNIKGGYLATKYLLQKYKKEVVILSGSTSLNTFFDRMVGYRDALKESGIEYNEALVHECDFTYEGGFKAVNKLLDSGINFRSIFAANDFIAIGAIRALVEKGIKIPQEVAIVGYDDIPISSVFIPSLSTVKQPKYEIGKKSAELIMEIIQNDSYNNKQLILEPSLVLRETT